MDGTFWASIAGKENYGPYGIGTGSFPEVIDFEMRAMLQGKTPGDGTQALFSSTNRNYLNPQIEYNPALWCAGAVDLSPISVTKSGTTYDRFPVTLVHESFVYAAAHIRSNGPYTFKRPDGGYETRSVVAWFAYPTITYAGTPPTTGTRDAAIGILSAPITTIQPAMVLPQDWYDYFPAKVKPPYNEQFFPGAVTVNTKYIQALSRRARKADGSDFARITVVEAYFTALNYDDMAHDTTGITPVTPYPYPVDTMLVSAHTNDAGVWGDTVIGGDSGSPIFWVFNGRMVLLAAHYTAGGGPAVSESLPALELKMNELATTYSLPGAGSLELHKVDLSSYRNFATE